MAVSFLNTNLSISQGNENPSSHFSLASWLWKFSCKASQFLSVLLAAAASAVLRLQRPAIKLRKTVQSSQSVEVGFFFTDVLRCVELGNYYTDVPDIQLIWMSPAAAVS